MELLSDEEAEEEKALSKKMSWDDMTMVELHHIGKKTRKVHKSQKDYSRKKNIKIRDMMITIGILDGRIDRQAFV